MKEKFKNILKYIYGLLFSSYIVFMGAVSKKGKWLDKLTFKTYKYIIPYSASRFIKCKNICEKTALRRISNKSTIKLAFVVYTGSMWFFDELYHLLDDDNHFSVALIVGHKSELSDIEFEKAINFFKNEKQFAIDSSESIPEYDVLFYLTPYKFQERELELANVSLSKVILHVSYSYMLSGNSDKLFLDMYHWCYRYYTDTAYYLNMIKNTVEYYSDNARFLGFPKMDSYYFCESKRLSDKTTIIFAPHHSVNYSKLKSATFEDNYLFFLELVEMFKDSVFWIYKPHPLLKAHCVQAGIFENEAEYDQYVNSLKNTGNVYIAEQGDYFPFFKSSDAMITDSISFLAEYQFSGKPLLLLMSGKEEYNAFGQELVKCLYKTSGNDYESIKLFVESVIHGNDEMREVRNNFFREYLDNCNGYHESSNRKIYNDIIDILY